jgi:hypothetical protein
MKDQPDGQAADQSGTPDPAADDSFEAHDARLNKELRRFDRARAGSPGAEVPHDENYAPGYHDGGVRFGFFSGKDTPEGKKPGGKG